MRGTIRLACFVTLAAFIRPEVIFQARATHPYLDIEVDEVDAEVAVRPITNDVPALRVVIATLRGVRLTARAAALAEVTRGVFHDAASSLGGGSLGGPQTS